MARLVRRALVGLAFVGTLFSAKLGAAATAACHYSRLTLGPAFELDIDEDVTVDRNRARLAASLDDARLIFDLDRGGAANVMEPRQFLRKEKRNAGRDAGAGSLREGENISLAALGDTPLILPLANGREVVFSRLYADVYAVKVSAQDRGAYRAFGQDLLGGRLCGRPFSRLPRDVRGRMKPQVTYFLFDALSSGQLDDYGAWRKFRPVFDAFLSQREKEDFLYIYGYRAAETLAREPNGAKIDTYKEWAFAWNAAAMMFHEKDSLNFTDVSSYQRGGKVEFVLLGSQPIPGGAENRFGFYTKSLGDLDLRGQSDDKKFHWNWAQGPRELTAAIDVQPAVPKDSAPASSFPGSARRGLIVLDVTLNEREVRKSVAAYSSYFRSRGFTFPERKELADAPAFVEGALARGDLDYLIRDGHSDGDDDNVMNLYRKGLLLRGRKVVDGKTATIDILYKLRRKPKPAIVSYSEFAWDLDRRARRMKQPLVFLDGSCWGIEKAWFGLAHAPATQLMEITASSPVNFFADTNRNAMRLILDGVYSGDSFAAIRERLERLPRYVTGREDQFIFPTDPLYPRDAPLARIDRRLEARHGRKPFRPYKPNGYF
jgi:hypothetical protein